MNVKLTPRLEELLLPRPLAAADILGIRDHMAEDSLDPSDATPQARPVLLALHAMGRTQSRWQPAAAPREEPG